ncbi:hypothetical protein ECANGB1_149 [Enterospora canceri]|uniref:Uncharacterized protein n=1 Tax=Enterospora canceri TaxID=1081671 RepID=A0A1Y1S938_9MICR|nr:hypothetical protein ECANGB1_149 [Enterospora canceri]
MFGSQKKEEVKRAETAVDANVVKANEALTNSAVARKLPKKVKNLGTEDLLKFAAVVKVCYFFPLFVACDLVATSRSDNWFIKFFSKFATWICYVVFIDFVNYGIYFLELYDMKGICYITTFIKQAISALFLLAMFFTLSGLIAKVSIIFMACGSLYVDAVFLLYLDIYFKELTGDDMLNP